MEKERLKELERIAVNMRINIIKMITEAGSGHPGGSLSIVEILTYLFIEKIKRNKENALSETRDRVILSKGHGVPALYAIFYETGLLTEKDLLSLRKLNSPLQGHPDRVRLPYVEASTGSLGQGLSIALGMALGAKLKKQDFNVYAIIGDGEMQEGQIWEALLKAPSLKLDNLIVFMDYNKFQLDGAVENSTPLEPVKEKLESFNWEVFEIDGHSFEELDNLFKKFQKNLKPKFVIAHTIKGKGVSFMENNNEWHGIAPTREQAEKAIEEIRRSL